MKHERKRQLRIASRFIQKKAEEIAPAPYRLTLELSEGSCTIVVRMDRERMTNLDCTEIAEQASAAIDGWINTPAMKGKKVKLFLSLVG